MLGLGHHLPERGRHQPADRRAPRRRRRTGSSSAPASARAAARAARAAHRHRHRGRRRRALQRRRRRPDRRSTSCSSRRMTPDEITPERRAATWRTRSAPTRAGAIDIGAACTGFLTALRVGRRADRGRPRARRVLVIGADDALALHRLRRQAAPRRCSATAPAPSSWADQDGGGVGPIVLRPTASSRERDHRPPRRPRPAHGRPHDVQARRQPRSSSPPVDAVRARRTRRSTTSTCSSTTRPTRRILEGGRRAARAPDARARRRLHRATSATRRPRRSRSRSRSRARTGRLRPGDTRAGRRRRRRLHLGRRASWSGEAPHEPEPRPERHRARDRRLARASAPRSPCALAADGWAVGVNYRSDEDGAEQTVEGDRGRRRPRRRASQADVSDADGVADDLFTQARGGARPGARARQQRRRRAPTGSRSSSTTSDWDTRHRHQPHRRLPPDARARCAR